MKKLTHVIESAKGFLYDIEKYTNDIEDAVTFCDFDCASKRLASMSGVLNEQCWVGSAYISFPRSKPLFLDTL
jgi:hypothetical protein